MRNVLVRLFLFGDGLPWSDAPYPYHLVPPDQQQLPPAPAPGEARALLSVVLVDAANNTARALRVLTLSPEFTRALHDAIRAQAASPRQPALYDAQLKSAYRHCPATKQMLPACRARCAGGA